MTFELLESSLAALALPLVHLVVVWMILGKATSRVVLGGVPVCESKSCFDLDEVVLVVAAREHVTLFIRV